MEKAKILDLKSDGLLSSQQFSVQVIRASGDPVPLAVRSVSGGELTLSNPRQSVHGKTSLPMAGDKVDDASLTLIINISESMNEYVALYNLLIDTLYGTDYYCTISQTIYSSHNNINRTIEYHDAVIATLTPPEYDATNTEFEPVTATVTFDYTSYTIK